MTNKNNLMLLCYFSYEILSHYEYFYAIKKKQKTTNTIIYFIIIFLLLPTYLHKI